MALDTAAPAPVWGSFQAAGMALALPLCALREVVPLAELLPLPTSRDTVPGALPVRGVAVPVVDLGRLCGRDAARASATCAVLVVHDGRLIGLLADGVTGVFAEAPGSRVDATTVADPDPEPAAGPEAGEPVATGERPPGDPAAEALDAFDGSVRRGDTGQTLTRLSMPALARLPGLPWIADPQPERSSARDDAADRADIDATGGDRVSLMRFECGPVHLAIDALAIGTTLWAPELAPSVLARGACRGTVDVAGQRIAALDLLSLCGLGELPAAGPRQALVVQGDGGHVALLVGRVVEIEPHPRASVLPLDAATLPRPALFAGMLAAGEAAPQTLVLDAAVLAAWPELRDLSHTNVPVPAASRGHGAVAAEAAAGGHGGGDVLVTFRLSHEMAVAMDTVREIAPFGDVDALFGPDNVLRRMQVVAGRSVPVYCLSRLLGQPAPAFGPQAVVIVVALGDRLAGFAVPALCSIERAGWSHELPLTASRGPGGDAVGRQRQRVVAVGPPGAQRTLQQVDLRALAAGLQDAGVAAHG